MSPKARRILSPSAIRPYAWSGTPAPVSDQPLPPSPPPQPAGPSAAEEAHLAALEREAFTKGYAQGERAGLEAGGKRAEAMLRRLTGTLEELRDLRATMIRQTERQMVGLAIGIARRVLRREVVVDREFIVALARVALDRLGEGSPATIRLNPEDYALTSGEGDWAGTDVKVVPDPAIRRGGCLIESEFGIVDASVEAQLEELGRALQVEEAGDSRSAGGHGA